MDTLSGDRTRDLAVPDPVMGAPAWPPPDRFAEPEGFVVELAPGERIHLLDWGVPAPTRSTGSTGDEPTGETAPLAGVLLVHGLGGTAWAWTAVARRLCGVTRTIAVDLRGHGLSDAPTEPYDAPTLVADLLVVAGGAGLIPPAGSDTNAGGSRDRSGRVVLAGLGYGAIVAAWTAAALGRRCAGLVLVDGGWQNVARETGLSPAEWSRDIAEPPEVLRSMPAFLADRRAWDPPSWDGDEERAARATVVEVPAGKLLPAIRPHALERSVEAIFAYDPVAALATLDLPIVAAVAAADESGAKSAALADLDAARQAAGRSPIDVLRFPRDGHNLPRYRPAELAQAILRLAGE
jgi:pimeloyl-ACP methyl ester carboxylesterase